MHFPLGEKQHVFASPFAGIRVGNLLGLSPIFAVKSPRRGPTGQKKHGFCDIFQPTKMPVPVACSDRNSPVFVVS
jgi:hypothetical protein